MLSEWRDATLNDLGEVNRGRSRHRPRYAEHLYGGPYPFIQTGDVRESGGRITKHTQTYSEEGLKQSRIWPAGTMCITIAANIAETAILTYPACFPDSVVGFIADDTQCDVRFVEYTFRNLKRVIQAEATGSVQDNINLATLARLHFKVPPLPEQKAIAHILGTLDDKIELNRKMNETLEAMAQTLFKSWFVDFDPVIDNALAAGNPIPDEFQKRATQRQALGDRRKPLPADIRNQFPDSFELTDEMGWIPKGWRAVQVEDAIDVNPRVKLTKGSEAPFVDMKALPTSGYSISNIIQKAYSGGAKFINGDVLLARITPCLENGKTGVVDFLDKDEVGFGSTEFIVLRKKGAISTPFVACLARDASFREHCKQSMVGSSGRQRIQNACFSNYYIAIPDSETTLRQFTLATEVNFAKMTIQTAQSREIAKLRDTLLPKLLSGEIRIPEAERMMEEVG